MVEVRKDNLETLALLAEQVLDGDEHVVERDVGGPGGGRVRRLDELCLNLRHQAKSWFEIGRAHV